MLMVLVLLAFGQGTLATISPHEKQTPRYLPSIEPVSHSQVARGNNVLNTDKHLVPVLFQKKNRTKTIGCNLGWEGPRCNIISCKNWKKCVNGECLIKSGKRRCNCSGTAFTGRRCEHSCEQACDCACCQLTKHHLTCCCKHNTKFTVLSTIEAVSKSYKGICGEPQIVYERQSSLFK